MGHTTCLGRPEARHLEARTCDGCDRCPWCDKLTMANLWCWQCCGKLTACTGCALRLAEHIVEKGPPPATPEGDFRFPEALAGYRAALSITRPQSPKNQQEVLRRYPILVSHLICASLGYFSPESAANALLAYIQGRPNFCEWYSHLAGGMHPPGFEEDKLLEVGRQVVEGCFLWRRNHTGYMASYQQARLLVEHVRRGGEGPVFGSWF